MSERKYGAGRSKWRRGFDVQFVQGTMLKRHLIAKRAASGADVEYFGWQDLFVGNEITLYGR